MLVLFLLLKMRPKARCVHDRKRREVKEILFKTNTKVFSLQTQGHCFTFFQWSSRDEKYKTGLSLTIPFLQEKRSFNENRRSDTQLIDKRRETDSNEAKTRKSVANMTG